MSINWVLIMAALLAWVLVIVQLLRTRKGRWALAAALGLPAVVLLGYRGAQSRISQVREAAPFTIQVPEDFRAFREAQVIQAAPPQKGWVLDAGGSQLEIVDYSSPSARLSARVRLPGPSGELVGYSGLEPTRDEALKRARRSVQEQLKALVLYQLAQGGQDVRSGTTSRWAEGVVEKLLKTDGVEVDRFEEEVRLPQSGATVHRAALLVRVREDWSREAVKSLAREMSAARKTARGEETRLGWTVLSAVLLGLVTYFLYSFLNAGSKGHLAWPLRIISIAAYLLLCLGLFFIRGHFS